MVWLPGVNGEQITMSMLLFGLMTASVTDTNVLAFPLDEGVCQSHMVDQDSASVGPDCCPQEDACELGIMEYEGCFASILYGLLCTTDGIALWLLGEIGVFDCPGRDAGG